MSWILQFGAWQYALAGAVCALGPILIHFLNRRRYTEIRWGAMELLRQATTSRRRVFRFRNLLLLVLRVVAVLLFGLALARPYVSSDQTSFAANVPRHLIVLIDNSLSMAYRTLDGTLLDRARRQATELIYSLPTGSRVSVVPICGESNTSTAIGTDAAVAVDALQSVELVDGMGTCDQIIIAAGSVSGVAAPLLDQIVLVSDMQQENWASDLEGKRLASLPKMLVRDVSISQPINTWVADVRTSDPVIAPESQTMIVATIRHQGPDDRPVQVTLSLDGRVVATQSMKLAADEPVRRVTFQCRADHIAPASGSVRFMHAEVSVTADRLPLDDERHVLVPVVDRLPVVFVDQFAAGLENVDTGLVGETWPMRQLLAAPVDADGQQKSMIQPQYIALTALDRRVLAPARLVVMAGVSDPGEKVPLLRQYVEQGGQLVIAAGGDFDQRAWGRTGWLSGHGLLPGPLSDTLLVADSEQQAERAEWFTMATPDFGPASILQLPGVSVEYLRQMYAEPLFLKAVEVQLDEDSRKAVIDAEVELVQKNLLPTSSTSGADVSAAASQTSDNRWLGWSSPSQQQPSWLPDEQAREDFVRQLADQARPLVHARLVNSSGPPLMIERRVGLGRILFFASGFLPDWTTLAQTNAVVLLDRIARDLVYATLPNRNFVAQQQVSVGLPGVSVGTHLELQRPGQAATESIEVGYIQRHRSGVVVPNMWNRGVYSLLELTQDVTSPVGMPGQISGQARHAYTVAEPGRNVRGNPDNRWRYRIAINGQSAESNLTSLRPDQRSRLESGSNVRWLSQGETSWNPEFSTSGGHWWRFLIVSVLVFLLLEMAILAWPFRVSR